MAVQEKTKAVRKRKPRQNNTGLQGGYTEMVRERGPIKLTVTGRLAERIHDLAYESHAARTTSWCYEALEAFVMEKRSGKFVPDPGRYSERNGDDFSDMSDGFGDVSDLDF